MTNHDSVDILSALKREDSYSPGGPAVDEIVERLDSRWAAETIVEIYLREGRIDDAFETVTNAGSLNLFETYLDALGDHDPAVYFDAYRRAIKQQAAEASRRKYYREVADPLRMIRRLGRDRRFENLVGFLRDEYDNRPAFIDELEDIDEV